MPRPDVPLTVTLTFDNGPEPGVTQHVLEVLKQEKILATFFVLGEKLADPARRRLAERARAEGHWIGNHTMTHRTPLGRLQDAAVAQREILETEQLIGELAHPDRLFRPFGGEGELGTHLLSSAAVDVLQKNRMTCVLWNAIPRDWEDPAGWVEVALAQCLAQPRTLLVLHDLPTGAMDNLGAFIARARGQGGAFRQDFPPECVPIRRGEVLAPLAPYVTA
ncbi:MAG TPA: polysaccharide deacetylase family protein [Burkholderiales bacterium]|nr:polysaccharide deacetylase family protein [Burkholderiales bacterium]